MKEKAKESLKRVKWSVHDQLLARESVMLRNIYAQLQNERLINDIKGSSSLEKQLKENPRYKYYSKIHELIHIKGIVDDSCTMKRVGRNRDGGYVMVYPLSTSKIAYSFGISDDVSWDKSMADKGYEVFMYDHTISGVPENNNRFHFFKIGVCGGAETDRLKTLQTLVKMNGHENKNGMVLKMDIEGCEWDVLLHTPDEIIKQFDQIVIEMHNLCNMSLSEKIIRVLSRLNDTHQAIHIHANNFADVDYYYDQYMPQAIEVTYVIKDKYLFDDRELVFPSSLDMPCDTHIPEIVLGLWNK